MEHNEQYGLAQRIDALNLPEGMVALAALGQAGFVVRARTTVVYIDPYLSNAISDGGGPPRAIESPLDPARAGRVDAILCTHEHADHTDPATVLPLAAAAPGAPIFASAQGAALLVEAGMDAPRVVTPSLGERHTVGDMTITALPAAHYSYEVDAEGRSRWMGFVIEANGVALYHAGDTVVIPELLAALQPYRLDLALLPINGRDYFREQQDIVGNLNTREVAELCALLRPRVLIPAHNDLFRENRVHPADLVIELERVVPRQRFHFLQPGEVFVYCG